MISSMMRYDIFSGKTLTFSVPRSRLRMPEERQEGQGTPGDEDESRDTVSENLEVDFSASVKKLPVMYPKGFNLKARPSI